MVVTVDEKLQIEQPDTNNTPPTRMTLEMVFILLPYFGRLITNRIVCPCLGTVASTPYYIENNADEEVIINT